MSLNKSGSPAKPLPRYRAQNSVHGIVPQATLLQGGTAGAWILLRTRGERGRLQGGSKGKSKQAAC